MTAMEELDGDTVRLSSRGKYAERDIVQVKKAISLNVSYLLTSQKNTVDLYVFCFEKDKAAVYHCGFLSAHFSCEQILSCSPCYYILLSFFIHCNLSFLRLDILNGKFN